MTRMPGFLVVWFGQLVSVIGSATSGFALSLWVYQETGSVTRFGVSLVCGFVPGILAAPFAGVVIDRWNRRAVLLVADAVAGLAMGGIVLAHSLGDLRIWHVYAFQAVASVCAAFQWPALTAAIAVLVPKQHLGRANGMVGTGQAVAELSAPLLAAGLLNAFGLGAVVAFDLVSFGFALLTLAVVRVPGVAADKGTGVAFVREVTEGWRYLLGARGLLGLLVFFAVCNFVTGGVTVLVTPLVLSVASVTALGTIASIGGFGMLAGGLLMSAWGGPARRVPLICGAAAFAGGLLLIAGGWPGLVVFGVVSFAYFFCIPVVNASSQTIWQLKVDPVLQGRVFSTRRMIAQSCVPIAYLLVGFLAERTDSGGPLVLAALGVVMVAAAGITFANPRVRGVESDLDAPVTQAAVR
ncbi:MFS transporter [Microtetraspora niveoalba]|uniref:MFS transporter n=1 Tax=Microtetraspora niveoalba TaxID=46175 RepID=UPI000A05B141|nr:MFS transporter [Microtetraspora niveoalba]